MATLHYKILQEPKTKNEVLKYLSVTRGYGYIKEKTITLDSLGIAVDIINDARLESIKTRIIGDYDVDGTVATYILVDCLRKFGINADYDIPNREFDGYGINKRIIQKAYDEGCRLIITCDNGIAATWLDEKEWDGLKIIITDHHKPVETGELPKVSCIVNPQLNKDSSFQNICGATVAWRLATEVAMPYVNPYNYLDAVAMATICDVCDLVDMNRLIVKDGLRYLAKTKNVGLKELLMILQEDSDLNIDTYTVGFRIGPCLNAPGRMDDAKLSVKLLLSKNHEEARLIARALVEKNKQRQLITSSGIDEAVRKVNIINNIQFIEVDEKYAPVIGIIAGRIKDKFHCPAMVYTFLKDKDIYKGSGRSIEKFDMFGQIAPLIREYCTTIGGHTAAIGFSIKKENLPKVFERLTLLSSSLKNKFERQINVEMKLPSNLVNLDLVSELDIYKPFGKGNEIPVFESVFDLCKTRRIGKNKEYLTLTFMTEDGERVKGTWFAGIDKLQRKLPLIDLSQDLTMFQHDGVKLKVIYSLCKNVYKGNSRLDLKIIEISQVGVATYVNI